MRFLGGILMILIAMVGVVEFCVFADPAIAKSVATRFAEHDPFPRLPWDTHMIFAMAFLLFLGAGLHFIFARPRNATQRT